MATASLWPGSGTYPSSSTYPGHGATGAEVYPAASLFPGSSTFPGQGDLPMHELLMSFDDASATMPRWEYVTGALRSFTITRGRENELATVDAGTENITLDNRDREFDPTYSGSPHFPNLRPMNRVWHRVRFAGETHDLFKGYVDSYDQQWPGKVDAVTIVQASDEFKVLALGHLPTTDPPRNSYSEVVQFDQPAAYWQMAAASASLSQQPTVGPVIGILPGVGGSVGSAFLGAIVGEQSEETYKSMQTQASTSLVSADLNPGDGPEAGGLNQLTVEAWLCCETLANQQILAGPYITGDVNRQYVMSVSSTGAVTFKVHNGAGYVTATSGLVLQAADFADPASWTHVVGVLDGSNVNLYINAILVATAAWSATIPAASATTDKAVFEVGDPAATVRISYDELAIYRQALTASRVGAHYNAGVARGFPVRQTTGQRANAVLDSASNQAPRTIDPGARQMQGRYMVGQDPLSELRVVEKAEAVDTMVFITRRGEVAFLDSAYRGRAGYVAPAITFSDDGRFLPYMDIGVDYSEAFLANEWNVTFTGGTTVTSSDATSLSRYLKRSQSLTDLAVYKLPAATDDQVIADAMVAKYREPMLRITSLAPKTSNSDVLEQVFRRDLGDRIRVIRTPDGGGAPIDQQLFIQKIEITGSGQSPILSMVFGVSPV